MWGRAWNGANRRNPHLIVMRQDRCDLATGKGDVLARKLIDCPGSGIEGVVESKVTTQAPVPAAQDLRKLQGQNLLIHSPPISTQAYYKLDQKSRQAGISSPQATHTWSPTPKHSFADPVTTSLRLSPGLPPSSVNQHLTYFIPVQSAPSPPSFMPDLGTLVRFILFLPFSLVAENDVTSQCLPTPA